MTGEIDDYRWLVGEEARPWLNRAAAETASLVTLAARLRRDLGANRARLVLQQVELRRRALAKFTRADQMFFTAVGLEQATDERVAAYKAGRFPQGQAIFDLCCGIGGDLLALTGSGPVVGVERNEVTALVAEANLHALAPEVSWRRDAKVLVADVQNHAWTAPWHLDPDRRPAGRRTTRVALHEPGWTTVERLLAEHGHAAIKLAPAGDVPDPWPQEAELEWISRARECRQLVAWFGALARAPGRRRATVLTTHDPAGASTVTGIPDQPMATAARIDRYLFEPDAAVLAARLTGELASRYGLAALGPSTAYLTGDRALADPALACFEVAEVLPYDMRRLKKLLAQRSIGRLEIKKRGVRDDLEQLRKRLALRGEAGAVLFLTRWGSGVTAILARRRVKRTVRRGRRQAGRRYRFVVPAGFSSGAPSSSRWADFASLERTLGPSAAFFGASATFFSGAVAAAAAFVSALDA